MESELAELLREAVELYGEYSEDSVIYVAPWDRLDSLAREEWTAKARWALAKHEQRRRAPTS